MLRKFLVSVLLLSAITGGGLTITASSQELKVMIPQGKELLFHEIEGEFLRRTRISMRVEVVPYSNLESDLVHSFAGGMPPDIALVDTRQVWRLAQIGALTALDEVLEPGKFEQSYSPWWRDVGGINGSLFVIPIEAYHDVLVWYRPDIFGDFGVRFIPLTWSGFLSNAELFQLAGLPPFALSSHYLPRLFGAILIRVGGIDTYRALANHEASWTDGVVVNSMEFLQKAVIDLDLLAEGIRPSTTEVYDFVFGDPPRAAMAFAEGWPNARIQQSYGLEPDVDYSFFALPPLDPSVEWSHTGVGYMAILLQGGAAPTEAKKFIRFLASADVAEIVARHGLPSPNREVLDTQAYLDYDPNMKKEVHLLVTEPIVPSLEALLAPELMDSLRHILQQFANGQVTLMGALESMEECATEIEELSGG